MATQSLNNPMKFEQGWPVIQAVVDKVIRITEGVDTNEALTSEEYMICYTAVYTLCHSRSSISDDSNAQLLYDKYKDLLDEYVSSKALPVLRGNQDEALLQELERRWANHKTVNRWLGKFFHYVNRDLARKKKLPPVGEVGLKSFYDLVFGEMGDRVKDAVMSMIEKEREGEQINQSLVKNVLAIYVEVGMGSMKYYEKDFEEAMFNDTAAFYSRKASNWIKSDSYKDYMLKVSSCLKHEREIVSSYLQKRRSQQKLLEIVEHELLTAYARELEEKKQLDAFPMTEMA